MQITLRMVRWLASRENAFLLVFILIFVQQEAAKVRGGSDFA
jgi:hypothetical protein